jgi:AcrR family transcriptional regulator
MASAERLFAAKGFNGTSMNDIVKDSGFSKGAIYGHFESKERLFLSLWERQTIVGIGQLRQMFSPDDNAMDKLLKVAEMTMASSCDCPREMGRMQIEFMHPRDIRRGRRERRVQDGLGLPGPHIDPLRRP